METKLTGWECLIDVLSNGQKEVPIELVKDFRSLAKLHKVEIYSDYLRDKIMPDEVFKNPWEWQYLENISKCLLKETEVLVLKGASARDMNLYPYPGLRQSEDLDIFIPHLTNFNEQKEFINFLIKEKAITVSEDWEKKLKKFKSIIVTYEGRYIDIHFLLFTLPDNIPKFNFTSKKKELLLEESILKRAIPYQSLNKIKKMSLEDFWFYNLFHFLANYPKITLHSLLDAVLVVKKNRDIKTKLKEHAKKTNQLFIYNAGISILNQLNREQEKTSDRDDNHLYKRLFKIERIIFFDSYSIKSKLISCLSKGFLVNSGNLFFSFLTSFTYFLLFIINNFLVNSTEDDVFSKNTIQNLFTKLLFTCSRIKNTLKKACLNLSMTASPNCESTLNHKPTDKTLISLRLDDIKLTFNVPTEFYNDLANIWEGYLSNDHLSQKINIEKTDSCNTKTKYEFSYNRKEIYMNLPYTSCGKANLNGSGNLYAKSFLDVRTFANSIIRAITFERDDLLLVHAGAVRIKDSTLIFPGGTSCGKTTLFNLLVNCSASGINDDTVLLKKEDNIWYVYPTPFMSKNQKPIICEKSKLNGIVDPIKVYGGHEIESLKKDHALAVLLNNVIADFTIDDGGYTLLKITKKVLELNKQVALTAKIKYSIESPHILFELIEKWLRSPDENFKFGSNFINLITLAGSSMEPMFKSGDVLCVEETYPNNLKPKDIVCFTQNDNGLPIVHRVQYLIKHKKQTTIITKGDRNLYEDTPYTLKSDKNVLKITGLFNSKKTGS